jgi:hypothetical protein
MSRFSPAAMTSTPTSCDIQNIYIQANSPSIFAESSTVGVGLSLWNAPPGCLFNIVIYTTVDVSATNPITKKNVVTLVLFFTVITGTA